MDEAVPGSQTTVVTVDTPPDPSFLMQLATGYWVSAALLAANELGVFGALADSPLNASDAAARCSVDARATTMLLDALCGLNLLVKQGDRYILSPAAATYLVPGRPGYLGSALSWSKDQFERWGNLDQAVRSGQPLVETDLESQSPEEIERFVRGMHERADGIARAVVNFVDLEGCRMLLDLGGGPGTYSKHLVQRYPNLQSVVFDLPAVVAAAESLATAWGGYDRIQFGAGDATFGDYGEGRYDAILMSGVLHRFGQQTIERMFEGAKTALTSGGRLIVVDIMTDATKTQPVFPTLFSLQMLLTTEAGSAFSAEECKDWMTSAGFVNADIRRLSPPLPYTVITAYR